VMPSAVLQEVLHSLSTWAVGKARSVTAEFNMPDSDRFHQFYMVCNSLFYMLCFRADDVLRLPNETLALLRQNVAHLLGCGLNPLLFTPKEIRKEMKKCVSMFNAAQIAQCVKANKRILLTARTQPVTSAFPFDPYLLNEGEKRLSPWYKHWDEDDVQRPLNRSPLKGFDRDNDDEDGLVDGDNTSFFGAQGGGSPLKPSAPIPTAHAPDSAAPAEEDEEAAGGFGGSSGRAMSLGTPTNLSHLFPFDNASSSVSPNART
jgi:hypothetical protein